MRQLFPAYLDPVQPAEVYADPPAVRVNMISSADGAASVDGRSGGLGGPADREVFHALRAAADVVLVGAGTVRDEGYGPSKTVLAIVSRSCHLDWGAPLFTRPGARPIVITVATAPESERARAREVADVLMAGEDTVDLRQAVGELTARGHHHVLAEGGATLNGALLAAGLIDELCLTLSPHLVGGASRRIVTGAPSEVSRDLVLRSACEEDSFLFLRYAERPSNDSRKGG